MNVLDDFTMHFRLRRDRSPRWMLESVIAAFATLPYENITKIIKRAEPGSPEKARRSPAEVVANHIAWGTGGTCFSLTYTLRHLVRALGFEAECILADRHYGPDTHCALLVWIDGTPHLLDPGFLIVRPISLAVAGEHEIETCFNRLILGSADGKGRIPLFTFRNGIRAYRLTYKVSPVDIGEFFKAWDASFSFDMMRYPLLTRVAGNRQFYLRGSRFQISKADSVERQQVRAVDLAAKIAAEFTIHPSVVERALFILGRKGDSYGETPGS
jgi:arylamine N-acetyltransferase